jgi:hypothetical protein
VVDVSITLLFERAKAIFDRQAGGVVQVVYKKRKIGADSAYSGKPTIGYEADATVDAVLVETGHAGDKIVPGVVSERRLILFVMTDMDHLDHLEYRSEEYEVIEPPRAIRFGDKYYGKIVKAQRVIGAPITVDWTPICPSGEQILNPGFETGDFTNYVKTGNCEVVDYDKHGGIYSARNPTGEPTATLTQTLATPLLGVCVTDFHLWMLSNYSASPPEGGKVSVEIHYTDTTFTLAEKEIAPGEADVWTLFDMTAYVDDAKTIEAIKVTFNTSSACLLWIDDLSLHH